MRKHHLNSHTHSPDVWVPGVTHQVISPNHMWASCGVHQSGCFDPGRIWKVTSGSIHQNRFSLLLPPIQCGLSTPLWIFMLVLYLCSSKLLLCFKTLPVVSHLLFNLTGCQHPPETFWGKGPLWQFWVCSHFCSFLKSSCCQKWACWHSQRVHSLLYVCLHQDNFIFFKEEEEKKKKETWLEAEKDKQNLSCAKNGPEIY